MTEKQATAHLRSRQCFGFACGFGFGALVGLYAGAAPLAVVACVLIAFPLTLAGCWFSLRAECEK